MKTVTIGSVLTVALALACFGGTAVAAPAATIGNSESASLNEKGVAALRSKDTKLAEELFEKALKADSRNLTAVYNLSGMYLTNKKSDQAEKLLAQYLDKGLLDAGLYARYGDALFADHKLKDAATAYEKALKIDPKLNAVPGHLAMVYSLSGRLDDAERMFLAAVGRSPKDASLLASLSGVFLANRKYDQAISAAKRSLQVKPTANAYETLGSAYEEMKDYKNSLISFQRAEQLGDNRPELKAKIEKIKQAAG